MTKQQFDGYYMALYERAGKHMKRYGTKATVDFIIGWMSADTESVFTGSQVGELMDIPWALEKGMREEKSPSGRQPQGESI